MALNKDERTYLENTAAAIIETNARLVKLIIDTTKKHDSEVALMRAEIVAMQAVLSEKADRNLWDSLKIAFKRKRKMDFSFTRKRMEVPIAGTVKA